MLQHCGAVREGRGEHKRLFVEPARLRMHGSGERRYDMMPRKGSLHLRGRDGVPVGRITGSTAIGSSAEFPCVVCEGVKPAWNVGAVDGFACTAFKRRLGASHEGQLLVFFGLVDYFR